MSVTAVLCVCSMDDTAQYRIIGDWSFSESSSNPGYAAEYNINNAFINHLMKNIMCNVNIIMMYDMVNLYMNNYNLYGE